MKAIAGCLALLLLAGGCLAARDAPVDPAAADPADPSAADACMAAVLDGLNSATEEVRAQGRPLSEDELSYHMAAWEQCGGANPYHLTATVGSAGRRLLGRANCASLSCYRNGITEGSVLCNAWCGLFAKCDAKPGKWGRCKYVG